MLPWERLDARTPVDDATTVLDALHGWGLLACAGASVAAACTAHRAVRPSGSTLRDAAGLAAGVALVAGAVLFPLGGGFAIGSGVGGQSDVDLGPGLPLAGSAGVLLAALSGPAAWSRRGGWRRRTSAGAR